jgi:TDG/mug DNA glycosylase family protein
MRGAYLGPGTGLAPLVGPNLRVLVCGFNPSIPAYRSGRYYANPGNRFYHLLHEAGLTPRLLSPAEDILLPAMGIGVTDLCPVPSAMAHDLPASAFAAGVETLKVLLQRCHPRVLCCNGYGVYRALMDCPPMGAGLQDSILFEGVPIFAMPSSSGAACALSAVRLAAWRELEVYIAAQA